VRTFAKASRTPAHHRDLLRELAVYEAVRDGCPATAARLPRDVRWSPNTGEIEMEAVPAGDLADLVAARAGLDPMVMAAVGRAVGEFHAEAAALARDAPPSAWVRGGIVFDRPAPAHMRLLSGAGMKLLKALQRAERLRARLAGLAPPSADSLIHGDLRWENVLVADDLEPPGVWLVDWETGGAGERAWDAGCIAAACVSAWLCSIPEIAGVPPELLVSEATLPMDAMAPGLDAYWAAYRSAAPVPVGDAWAERCVQLAAVRLVHAGFERTAFETGLRPSAVAHLQIASHILDEPARAGRELLRIA
jgi:hypothetical protein